MIYLRLNRFKSPIEMGQTPNFCYLNVMNKMFGDFKSKLYFWYIYLTFNYDVTHGIDRAGMGTGQVNLGLSQFRLSMNKNNLSEG